MALCLPLVSLAETPQAPRDCVVLLHGLWRTELSMKWLQWELEEAGFTTANPTYPSLRYPIEELAIRAVEQGVSECQLQYPPRIHFVTHSLGGILVRSDDNRIRVDNTFEGRMERLGRGLHQIIIERLLPEGG